MDTVSHNLSNANTTSFKESLLLTRARVDVKYNDEGLLHQDEDQKITEGYVDYSQGSLIQTEDDFDFALEGQGFFTVRTPDGVRYTRSGAFTKNALGELVTLSGHQVLDQSEATIQVEGKSFNVSESGSVYLNGVKITALKIVDFADKSGIMRDGHNYYKVSDGASNPVETSDMKVLQGMLEGSNVNVVEGMVEMIRYNRQFESSQKAIHTIDESVGKAINEIGKTR